MLKGDVDGVRALVNLYFLRLDNVAVITIDYLHLVDSRLS